MFLCIIRRFLSQVFEETQDEWWGEVFIKAFIRFSAFLNGYCPKNTVPFLRSQSGREIT